MQIIININDMVKVKLTPLGKKVLKEHFRNRSSRPSIHAYEDELWSVMSIFKDYLYVGAQQVFVNNEIKLIST